MNPYFEQTILNADPVDLVRIMYQRAISWVGEARAHLEHGRIAKRSAAIARAYTVLAELLAALRPELAPELSRRLKSLYLYMQQRLLDANMQQSDQPLAEVIELLITLDAGWSGVVAEVTPKRETQGASAVTASEVNKAADVRRWHQAEQASEDATRHAVSA